MAVTAKRTDLSNAERLVELHGDDLRFVGTWKKGMAWDGQRWLIDETGRWHRAGIQTARTMLEDSYDEMREAAGDEDRVKEAKKNIGWAITSQSASRLQAMTQIARSAVSLAVVHSELDADPMLLTVQNGTLDLKTGELREHRRTDLITKLAPVDYDPDAACPTWDAFLARSMNGDTSLIRYLQKIIGYALTGSVKEHLLGFFFGGGANGKSTFLGTIHAMLGDYAMPASRGLLFRGKGERHPTELASLHGRRFVTCSEVEEGQAFDEALIKDLTGGDPINARRMREDEWTFQPTHKLFFAGNHKPVVRGDDEGIWRRMRLVPWTVTIPAGDRDASLLEKMRAELPGILRWAVEGCLAWQKEGLEPPESVLKATSDYRQENDVLGEFFRLQTTFDSIAVVPRKDLREAYELFCKESGFEPFGAKRFSGRLREKGVTESTMRVGMKVVNAWRGVRLASDAEREASARWGTNGHAGTSSDDVTTKAGEAQKPTTAANDVPASDYEDDGSLSFFNKREGIQ